MQRYKKESVEKEQTTDPMKYLLSRGNKVNYIGSYKQGCRNM
jgi:hypothetical protein